MIELIAAIFGGAAANQLDHPVSLIRDAGWELIARYIIGELTIMIFFALMLRKLHPDALKDGMLSIAGSSAGVGLGVVGARIIKDLTESKPR